MTHRLLAVDHASDLEFLTPSANVSQERVYSLLELRMGNKDVAMPAIVIFTIVH